MPGSETIKLDPVAEATNRTELDITDFVALDGVDWGNADIEAYMAQRGGVGGAEPIDYWVPNREITMPLRLQARGTLTFNQIRTKLQAKVGLAQREGMILGRVTSNGGTVFADVVNASLKLGGGWGQARGRYDENAELHLECLPDWYEAEVQLSSHDETSLPELVFTETDAPGDYPNRVRIVVTDLQGRDQLGLIWGVRSRNYSSASTARLAYEAEALTPMGAAAVATRSGASGGASNNVISGTGGSSRLWRPLLNTNLVSGGSYLTHKGSYRVFARVWPGSLTQLRFVWDVGDMTNPVENEAWTSPDFTTSTFVIADLGEIRLDATTGTHRWQGQIQTLSDGVTVDIDRVFFVPIDEGAGRLTTPFTPTDGLTAYVGLDSFDSHAAGNLNAKVAPVGGAWATSGVATDFAVETTGFTVQRTTTGDATPRFAISGMSAIAAQVAQVDIKLSAATGTEHGVITRWTDSSNYFTAKLLPVVGQVQISAFVAGVQAQLALVSVGTLAASTWYTLRLAVNTGGHWGCWLDGQRIAYGQYDTLATGGTLATGKAGFVDRHSGSALTRNFDNFGAWPATPDAVVFANQSVELRTDGMFREDSGGVAYGPVSRVIGDLPRLPPAGLEGRTVEVFVKPSRGDLDQLADAGIDDVRAQVFRRACWLYVPDDASS